MNHFIRLSRCTFFLVILGLSMSIPLKAEDAKEPVLLLHLQTGPITETVTNMEAFILNAVKDSPMLQQLGIQSNFMEQQVINQLIQSLSHTLAVDTAILKKSIDRKLSVHFNIFAFGEPLADLLDGGVLKDGDGFVGFLPLNNFAQFIESLGAQGVLLQKDEDGVYNPGGNLLFTNAGNYLVVVNKKETLMKALHYLKKHPDFLMKKLKNGSDIRIRVNLDKIMVTYGIIIRKALDEAGKEIIDELNEDVSLSELWLRFYNPLKTLLLDTLNNSKRFDLSISLNAAEFRIETMLHIKKNTVFHQLLNAYAKADPEHHLVKLLPHGAFSLTSYQYNAKVAKLINPWILSFLSDLAAAVEPRSSKQFKKSLGILLDQQNGETAQATYIKNNKEPITFAYLKVKDSKIYINELESLVKSTNELLPKLMRKLRVLFNDTSTPHNIIPENSIIFRKNTGKITLKKGGNIPYSVFEFSDLQPPPNDMQQLIKLMIGLSGYMIAPIDAATIGIVSLTKDPKYLDKIVNAYLDQKEDPDTMQSLKKGFKTITDKAIAIGMLDPIELIKFGMLSQGPDSMRMFQELFVNAKPALIYTGIGMKKKGNTLNHTTQVPISTIQEMVKVAERFFMMETR